MRSVMVIGDVSHPEMAHLLPSLTDVCQLSEAQDLAAAIDQLAKMSVPPELFVLAQTRPGEHSQATLGQLRFLAPLAGLCVVLGSQCEGETRTGQPLPGIPRIFWHQWPQFWQEQRARWRRGLLPAWSLPATASEEDRLLATTDLTLPVATRCCVAVLATTHESAQTLADAIRAVGYCAEIGSASAVGAPDAADIVLWDASPAALADQRQVQAIRRQFPSAALIGLATFPRHTHHLPGIDAVIAKPFRLELLQREIERRMHDE